MDPKLVKQLDPKFYDPKSRAKLQDLQKVLRETGKVLGEDYADKISKNHAQAVVRLIGDDEFFEVAQTVMPVLREPFDSSNSLCRPRAIYYILERVKAKLPNSVLVEKLSDAEKNLVGLLTSTIAFLKDLTGPQDFEPCCDGILHKLAFELIDRMEKWQKYREDERLHEFNMLKGNGTTNMHKMNLGFPTIAPFDTEEVGKNENENADGGWGADSKPPSSKEQSRDRSTWSAHALTQSERKDENKFVVNAEGSPLRKELLQSEAVEQAEVRPRKSRARQDVPNVGSAEIAGQIATAVNEGDYHYTSRVIAAGQERTWPPSSNEPYKDQARIPESKQEDSLNTNGPGVVLGTVKAGSVHGDEENRLQLVLREDMPAAPNPNVFDMNVAMRLEGSLAQEPNGTPVEFTVERDNDGSIIFVARPKLRRIDAHATPQAEEKSEMAQPERKGTNGEVARYDPEGNIDVDQSSAKLDTPRLKPVEEKVKSQAIPDDVFEYMRIMWKEDPMLSQEFEEIWNQQPERQNELIDKMHQNMMLERQKLEGRKRLEALRRENTPAAARVLFEPDGAREPPSANMKRTAVKHEDTEGSRHHSISVNAAKTNEQPKPSGARLPVSGGPIKNTLMEIPQKNTLEAIPEPELIEISPESIARYYYIRKHRDGQGTANVSASDTNAPTILQFQSFLTSEFRDHPELIDLLRRKFSANPERKLVYVETLHDAMLAQAKTRSFPNDREPHVVQQKEDNAPQQKENKPQQTENKPQPGVKGKKAQKGIERYFQTPDEEPYDMEEFLKNPNAGIQW